MGGFNIPQPGLPNPGGSSNQWYDVLPPAPQPGSVGGSGGGGNTTRDPWDPSNMSTDWLGGDQYAVAPIDPGFTGDFSSFLSGQVGKGATPYGGDLSAPQNDLLSALEQFYKTGKTDVPGLDTLAEMSKTGMPIDQLPAWQAMVEAQQRNIGQNAEQIREQMAFSGNLKASPFGNALTDYFSQTSKDQNAMLLQAQTAAMEAARGRQTETSQFLTTGMANLGQVLQGLDQASVDRLFAEFIRTRPEYAPLLNMMFAYATTFPPVLSKNYGIGAGGALLGSAGSIASGVADIIDVFKKSAPPSGGTPNG